MAKGKGKGSQFERDVSRALGMWWTGGERDDIFWRTQTSGGRATERSEKSKKTYGQYGDIQAVDPIGQPFMDLCCMELKRGYPHASISDLIELENSGTFGKWIAQACKSTRQAACFYPMVLTKRNLRRSLVCYPLELHNRLMKCRKVDLHSKMPWVTLWHGTPHFNEWVVLRFDDFLRLFSPKNIIDVLVDCRLANDREVTKTGDRLPSKN